MCGTWQILEHGNRFFSGFPIPKSVAGFAHPRQSLYVGVGLLSKQFDNRWYTTWVKTDEVVPDYSSTVKPCMTPDKRQSFALLERHVLKEDHIEFSMSHILSI